MYAVACSLVMWTKNLLTDPFKVSLLEQLKVRIRHRTNINYVEEEYSGAVPVNGVCQVFLGEEDQQLMWKLFHYASKQGRTYESHELQHDSTPNATGEGPVSAILGPLNIREGPNQSSTNDYNHALDQDVPSLFLGTISSLGTPDTNYGDWSLFGKSWLGYFH